MKYKIGDRVMFINKSNKEYAWELNIHEIYVIINRAVDNLGYIFYGVKNKNGSETTWYDEQDFVGLKECRKLKLEKIKEKYGN